MNKYSNKNKKEESKIDWKKAEIGAAWKRQTTKGKDYYFIKIKLNRLGINQELVLKGYRNNYQNGNNPPTMMLYCFDDDNQFIEDFKNDPSGPLSIDLPAENTPAKKENSASKALDIDPVEEDNNIV